MKLRNDPYQVFRFSRTPAGLYARQKWLGEADSSQWKTDFEETVDVLLSDQSPDGSWHHETAATINIFRALVVHPVFAKDKATELALDYHADLQKNDGAWGDDLSFYQTLNALAHLDLSHAETQLERAFERLYETQNRDGTWSRSEPEWNTFLAIHALKNKGLL